MPIQYGDEEGVREIALTFDDGPNPGTTPQVLDVLAERDISAVFFVLGERLETEQGRKLMERAYEEGHRIGNHTYSHPNLRKCTPQEIRKEIQRTEELIGEYAADPKLFRPPYGATNAKVQGIVQDEGYLSVLWNVDTLDWKLTDGSWVENGFEQVEVREDSLVLMHDIHDSTAENLEEFLQRVDQLSRAEYVSYV